MALYKLLLPKMGESVAEATVIKWNKAVGDHIDMDDTVMEIATDKVDSEVPSPVAGKLVEQLFRENDVVQVGSVIAMIETGEVEEVTFVQPDVAAPEPVVPEAIVPPVQSGEVAYQETSAGDEPVPASAISAHIPGTELLQTQPVVGQSSGGRFYSPLVKNIATAEKVSPHELDNIPGSGSEGRLTKDDLLQYIKDRANRPVTPAPAQPSSTETAQMNTQQPISATKGASAPQKVMVLNAGDEIIEMDRMRRLIADHMVMSVRTSPHVTSFIEVDVTNLVQWREKVKTTFEQREGTKITFTPIFIEAVARSIKDMPMINVAVNGTQIIKRKDINIGMATALPSGNLIVPVIRKANELNLVGLSKAVNDLSARARNNKLQPDEVRDGTFTITNIGTFGNVMGTPIINQPQVAILAVGAIKKKPAVIETPEGDIIAIRHLMYLSLSYDHRVVDGALGGMFIRKVADYLEAFDINRSY